tara:strand:+ start:3990 stop:4286 length:297 start_codon:yes stop_codon:yes gene_type:complete
MNLLDNAITKVTNKMMDEMEHGQSIKLNKRFELYKYEQGYTIGVDEDYDEPEYFVLRDYSITEDETYCEDGFVVQTDQDNMIVFTDVLGYDDDENFTD